MVRCSFPTTTTAFSIGSATRSDGRSGRPARRGDRIRRACAWCGERLRGRSRSGPAQFVSTELFLFREGNRKDPQMSPIAAGLSNGDLNDLAEYFAAEKLAP